MCVALDCHACGAVACFSNIPYARCVAARWCLQERPFTTPITTIGQYGQSQSGKRAVTFCFLLQQIDSPQLALKIRSSVPLVPSMVLALRSPAPLLALALANLPLAQHSYASDHVFLCRSWHLSQHTQLLALAHLPLVQYFYAFDQISLSL